MSALFTPDITQQKLGLEELKQLMRSVNETTERLEQTHGALRQQVTRLQGELAEANARLRRSRALAALGEMAAGIAHEVRNPLASIRLYVQMLQEDLGDRPPLAAQCDKIGRAVEGLDAIVRDVLHFAKDRTLSLEPTTAAALIDRVLTANRPLLDQAGVHVLGPGEANARITADTTLLSQSLGNVVRNAVQAMVEAQMPRRELTLGAMRKRVRLGNGRRVERVLITVRDTGPGITPDVLKRMFNPFFTTRHTGTGLGLAIVHRIVEAHGGHVSVRNAPDGGALVELCLPDHPPVSDSNDQVIDVMDVVMEDHP